MAILTSKGARAPHQLKGKRSVRISRDRRGSGDEFDKKFDKIEEEIIELTSLETSDFDEIMGDDLTSLETSEKTNLVSYKNEVVDNVNEVAKITSWSTEEKVIGKWIDGKPIYRQVLNINAINLLDWQYIPETNNLNIKKLIKVLAMGTADSFSDSIAVPYVRRDSNGNFQFVVYSWNLVATTLILEYTKTTD